MWACRWVERSLRELRGEARLPPPSLKDVITRGNEFIEKIKESGAKPKAAPKPKPEKPKASSKSSVEPKFETLEKALEAAHACSKCIATKFGTKGCRACMGELFEEIRQKKYPKH